MLLNKNSVFRPLKAGHSKFSENSHSTSVNALPEIELCVEFLFGSHLFITECFQPWLLPGLVLPRGTVTFWVTRGRSVFKSRFFGPLSSYGCNFHRLIPDSEDLCGRFKEIGLVGVSRPMKILKK